MAGNYSINFIDMKIVSPIKALQTNRPKTSLKISYLTDHIMFKKLERLRLNVFKEFSRQVHLPVVLQKLLTPAAKVISGLELRYSIMVSMLNQLHALRSLRIK